MTVRGIGAAYSLIMSPDILSSKLSISCSVKVTISVSIFSITDALKILEMATRSCVCSGGSLETSTPVPGSEYANPGPNFEDHIFSSRKAPITSSPRDNVKCADGSLV